MMATGAAAANRSKAGTSRRDIFTEDEMRDVIGAVEIDTKVGLRDKAILELLYVTGIRSGELCRLTLQDVDPASGQLTMRPRKGKRGRIIPFVEATGHWLNHYMEHGRPGFRNSGSLSWLFLTAGGGEMKSSDVTRIVQKYAKRVGIERHTSARMIRNSMAAHMYYHGVPIRVLQEILGLKYDEIMTAHGRIEAEDLKRVHRKTHSRNRGVFA